MGVMTFVTSSATGLFELTLAVNNEINSGHYYWLFVNPPATSGIAALRANDAGNVSMPCLQQGYARCNPLTG